MDATSGLFERKMDAVGSRSEHETGATQSPPRWASASTVVAAAQKAVKS